MQLVISSIKSPCEDNVVLNYAASAAIFVFQASAYRFIHEIQGRKV